MKLSTLLIAILPLALFKNCYVEDDVGFNKVCSVDCTEIRGRLSTEGSNTPISNLPLELTWDYESGSFAPNIGGYTRKIASTQTDSQGNYVFRFFINDRELTDPGGFNISFSKPDDTFMTPPLGCIYFRGVTKRDTLIDANFLLPKKGKLKLKLNNPEAVGVGDRLLVSVTYNFGNNSNHVSAGLIDFGVTKNEILLTAAGNQKNFISIFKVKNGTETFLLDTVYVSLDQADMFEVNF